VAQIHERCLPSQADERLNAWASIRHPGCNDEDHARTTAGAEFRTPFPQDEPYRPVEGFDTCSIWMPLVPAEKKSALEFVRGSHRWPHKYRQTNFGALTGDTRDQAAFSDDGTVPFPDVEGNGPDFDILEQIPT